MLTLKDSFSQNAANYITLKCYNHVNATSENRPVWGRCLLVGAVLIEAAVNTVKEPATAIEWIVCSVFNLVSNPHSKSLKGRVRNLEYALNFAFSAPVRLLLVPVKLVHQLAAGLYKPALVIPNYYHSSETFYTV